MARAVQFATGDGFAIVINGAVPRLAIPAELQIGIKALARTPRERQTGAGEGEVPAEFGGSRPCQATLSSVDDGIVVLAV
jgi:hypothetical protein